jgi:hypothetical protein
MVEKGNWSLCRTFSLFTDTVTVSASDDYQLAYKIADKIPAGTYPFEVVLKFVNKDSTQDASFQMRDASDTVLAEVTIGVGKAGIMSFPPLKDLAIYHKGGESDINLTIFLGSVES